MYSVTNPKSGKTYTYGDAKKEQAVALAEKLGVSAVYVAPKAKPYKSQNPWAATCVCGRPEDTHESYDCWIDHNLVNYGEARPNGRLY